MGGGGGSLVLNSSCFAPKSQLHEPNDLVLSFRAFVILLVP